MSDIFTEIVTNKLFRKAKTPIALGVFDWNRGESIFLTKSQVEEEEKKYKIRIPDEIARRVYTLLQLSRQYPTYSLTKKRQCRSGANRSAQDLWRMYKYYYDKDISIFPILRAIHALIYKYEELCGQYCFVVRKLVFWCSSAGAFYDTHSTGDLGVTIGNWQKIGEKTDGDATGDRPADVVDDKYSALPLMA